MTSIGTRFGPYEIVAILGAGGMGEVYRARDTGSRATSRSRSCPRRSPVDPERLARFEREARTLAALNHPNIAAIYGLEDADGVRASCWSWSRARRSPSGSLARPVPLADGRPLDRPADRRGARGGAREGHRPPRSEAGQHQGHSRRLVKVLDFGLAKAADGSGSESAGADVDHWRPPARAIGRRRRHAPPT